MKDASNIGSDKPVQDPQDAIESSEGTYQCNVTPGGPTVPEQMPKAPDPQPFQRTGGGGGTR